MEFRVPELGEGVYEAELVSWLVQVGDSVKRGQNLMEVLTDKATMEVPSPFIGTIQSLHAKPGEKIKIGDLAIRYGDGIAPAVETTKTTEPAPKIPRNGAAAAVAARTSSAGVKAAPSVRQMARKLGIELGTITGTGPDGRVLIEDLRPLLVPAPAAAAKPKKEVQPEFGIAGTRVKLQGVRRRIAEHMVHSVRTIPHYTYVEECEVTELVRLRGSLKETFASSGLKLTYLAFALKAVACSLKEVPIVNSSLDEKTSEIVLHPHYHIGIAVATANGLVVPVLHDADKKDLPTIAREIEQLTNKARGGKLALDDLRGGTFTISSIGNVGGVLATPIINHPEVGIVALGRVMRRPMFDELGQVRPADLMYLSFSFDHRIVDGAVGAAFGNAMARRLQNPATLLLPEKLN